MANVSGIAIQIKAFMPIGSTIADTMAALSSIEKAEKTGDYTEVLKSSNIEAIKVEQKTRRMKKSVEAEVAAGEAYSNEEA